MNEMSQAILLRLAKDMKLPWEQVLLRALVKYARDRHRAIPP